MNKYYQQQLSIASLTEPEGTFTDSAVFSGAEMFGTNGHQDLIINGSEVYGNVIAGNNAGDIHSDFLENTVRERSIRAGDTEFLGRRWSKGSKDRFFEVLGFSHGGYT